MSANFPDSPIDGELFTVGFRTWQWSSALQAWRIVGSPVSLTGPTGVTGAGGTGPTGATGAGVTGATGPTTDELARTLATIALA